LGDRKGIHPVKSVAPTFPKIPKFHHRLDKRFTAFSDALQLCNDGILIWELTVIKLKKSLLRDPD